ncbi:MAG: barnase inhibitor [Rhodospirillales bacterium]|nr:MAG: barnase inhibitor [Rhodospirillales bacterium]
MRLDMRTCNLDGRAVGSLDQAYDILARQLGFPAHFGRNLDALWDVLTTDLEGPCTVRWHHCHESEAVMGPDFQRLLAVLQDAAQERPDLCVEVDVRG